MLEELTKKELEDIAKQEGVTHAKSIRKADLIELITLNRYYNHVKPATLSKKTKPATLPKKTIELEDLTKAELKEICKRENIPTYYWYTKRHLLYEIHKHYGLPFDPSG